MVLSGGRSAKNPKITKPAPTHTAIDTHTTEEVKYIIRKKKMEMEEKDIKKGNCDVICYITRLMKCVVIQQTHTHTLIVTQWHLTSAYTNTLLTSDTDITDPSTLMHEHSTINFFTTILLAWYHELYMYSHISNNTFIIFEIFAIFVELCTWPRFFQQF